MLDIRGLPHGGWRYQFPQTAVEIRSHTFNGLLAETRNYMVTIGFPVPEDLAGWLQEAICASRSPFDAAQLCRWPGQPAQARVAFEDIARFLDTLTHWLTESREFVSQDEATVRAATCAQCPQNVFVSGCTACKALLSRILSAVAGRTTPVDFLLKSCAICKCANAAQVHIPLAVLHNALSSDQVAAFPPWCWKRL